MKKTAILCLGLVATFGMMAAAQATTTFTTEGSFSADCGKGPSPPWGPPTGPGDAWGTFGGPLGKICAPIPEPSTWAMMIAGVALLGTIQLRRRSAKAVDEPMAADGALA
jgi:hypothetical protein